MQKILESLYLIKLPYLDAIIPLQAFPQHLAISYDPRSPAYFFKTRITNYSLPAPSQCTSIALSPNLLFQKNRQYLTNNLEESEKNLRELVANRQK